MANQRAAACNRLPFVYPACPVSFKLPEEQRVYARLRDIYFNHSHTWDAESKDAWFRLQPLARIPPSSRVRVADHSIFRQAREKPITWAHIIILRELYPRSFYDSSALQTRIREKYPFARCDTNDFSTDFLLHPQFAATQDAGGGTTSFDGMQVKTEEEDRGLALRNLRFLGDTDTMNAYSASSWANLPPLKPGPHISGPSLLPVPYWGVAPNTRPAESEHARILQQDASPHSNPHYGAVGIINRQEASQATDSLIDDDAGETGYFRPSTLPSSPSQDVPRQSIEARSFQTAQESPAPHQVQQQTTQSHHQENLAGVEKRCVQRQQHVSHEMMSANEELRRMILAKDTRQSQNIAELHREMMGMREQMQDMRKQLQDTRELLQREVFRREQLERYFTVAEREEGQLDGGDLF